LTITASLSFYLINWGYQYSSDAIKNETQKSLEYSKVVGSITFSEIISNLNKEITTISNNETVYNSVKDNNKDILLDELNIQYDKLSDSFLDVLFIKMLGDSSVYDASSSLFDTESMTKEIGDKFGFVSNFNFYVYENNNKKIYVITQSVPIVEKETGRIMARLFGGIILNNNLELLNLLQSRLSSRKLSLRLNNEYISTNSKNQFVKKNETDEKYLQEGDFIHSTFHYDTFGEDDNFYIDATFYNPTFSALSKSYRYKIFEISIYVIIIISILMFGARVLVIAPLRNLLNYSENVISGEVEQELSSSSVKEFNQLGRRFEQAISFMNEKKKEVVKFNKELNHLNENLEKIVEERTKKLNSTNLELEESIKQIHSMQSQVVESKKMASLGILVKGVAHELRNPLNFTLNFSKISLKEVESLIELLAKPGFKVGVESTMLTERLARFLQKVISNSERIESIITKMGMLGKTGQLKFEECNLQHLINRVFLSEKHLLDEIVCFDVDMSVSSIICAKTEFRFIIKTLLNNSIYAINEKREKEIDFNPFIRIASFQIEGKTHIEILDNGTGIKKEHVDKIAEPFFTTKPPGLGAGLGVTIAYDFIKKHHGQIVINSEQGQWTKVVIVLDEVFMNSQIAA